ncbi:MAG: copper amine oxidase N-terminal domain-containing protein [Oscillospiraceae bacterium]|nr:copper amine oxidase N-terminal domain-containing protein [Oscillospiraceae bacterium]
MQKPKAKKLFFIIPLFIISTLLFACSEEKPSKPAADPDSPPNAISISSKVIVDGDEIEFDAYNIEGDNYFKLRDLAYVLSRTEKQFDVGWDNKNDAITLTSGKLYTVTGGELANRETENKYAAPTNSKIYLDGEEISLTAYNIEGNNYFNLTDIAQAFDFGVDWDREKNTIVIDTGKSYKPQ